MAGTQLQIQDTPQVAAVRKFMSSPEAQEQVSMALVGEITQTQLMRSFNTALSENPKLGLCNFRALARAVCKIAGCGLTIGGVQSHAWIVPFENRKENAVEPQVMIGYRGWEYLFYKSGIVASSFAMLVFQGDEFGVMGGLEQSIHHKPDMDAPHTVERLTHAYAVAHLVNPAAKPIMVWTNRAEMEHRRKCSKSQGAGSAWVNHPLAMYRKGAYLGLVPWIPLGPGTPIDNAAKIERDSMIDVEAVSHDAPVAQPGVDGMKARLLANGGAPAQNGGG